MIHDTKIMASLLKKKVPKTFLDQYELDRKAVNKEDRAKKLRKASANSLKSFGPILSSSTKIFGKQVILMMKNITAKTANILTICFSCLRRTLSMKAPGTST